MRIFRAPAPGKRRRETVINTVISSDEANRRAWLGNDLLGVQSIYAFDLCGWQVADRSS
jgi:hypothetical protein